MARKIRRYRYGRSSSEEDREDLTTRTYRCDSSSSEKDYEDSTARTYRCDSSSSEKDSEDPMAPSETLIEDWVRLAARAYAYKLVTFLVEAHGISCIGEVPEFRYLFHPNAGKVVVACAKTFALKYTLFADIDAIINDYDLYQRNYIKFCNSYIRHAWFEIPMRTFFLLFAGAIEVSVFAYMRGVPNTGEVATNNITELLLAIDDGKFVANGGLNILNNYATHLLLTDPELKNADSELFASCNFANIDNETVLPSFYQRER